MFFLKQYLFQEALALNDDVLTTSRTFISSSLILYEQQKAQCIYDKVNSSTVYYNTLKNLSSTSLPPQPHQVGITILELSKVIMQVMYNKNDCRIMYNTVPYPPLPQHYYYLVLKPAFGDRVRYVTWECNVVQY